jgi:transposase-like protein
MNRREELLKDIREIATQYRAEMPDGHKAWPKSVKDRVAELVELGMTSTEIAKQTGIAYFTVQNWRKRARGFRALQIASLPVRNQEIANESVVVVTMTMPNGIRIDGVPLDQAIAFARKFK